MHNYLIVHQTSYDGKPLWLGHLLNIGEMRTNPIGEDILRVALCGAFPAGGWGSLSSTPDQDGPGRICTACQTIRDERAAELSIRNDSSTDESSAYTVSPGITNERLTALRSALQQITDSPAGPVWQLASDALAADDRAAQEAEVLAVTADQYFKLIGWPGEVPDMSDPYALLAKVFEAYNASRTAEVLSTVIPACLDPLRLASEQPEGILELEGADRFVPDSTSSPAE